MAHSAQRADARRFCKAALTADDRADCDDVIRIGCVPKAEEETERENAECAKHWILRLCTLLRFGHIQYAPYLCCCSSVCSARCCRSFAQFDPLPSAAAGSGR